MLTQLIPTIHKLNKLALKKIFDRANLTKEEYKELEEGVNQQMRKARITNLERKELKYIIACLIKDERGGFDKLKDTIKKHRIDYTKMFRMGL